MSTWKMTRRKADECNESDEVLRRLQDPFWRLQNLYHIKSEDTGSVIQFRPYPEQMEVFKSILIEGHQRLIIPKARRRGMSTGIDLLMFDQALTKAGYEAGIVDRNQADASKKLENIIKTSYDKLPQICKNGLATYKNNDDRLAFQTLGDTVSNLYASTGYRGGNCNFLHISEWGWIQCEDPKRSEEIQTGAVQAARKGIIVVETTWKGGKNGHLWDYMDQSLTTPEKEKNPRSWRHLFFPWHTDLAYSLNSSLTIRPECEEYFEELENEHNITLTIGQKRWYQEEAWPLRNNRFGEYPSTLEECFKSPMDGVIYEMEMARTVVEKRITRFPIEKGLPVFASFDIGRNDAMPITLIQPVGKELRVVGYYVSHRETARHYGDQLKIWMKDNQVTDLRILLPHDGGRRSVETGKTLSDAFYEMGFPNVQVVPKIPNVWTGINYVKDTFEYLYIHRDAASKVHQRGTKKFPSLLECLNNYHQAQNANGVAMSTEPVHDDYSHGCFVGTTMVSTPDGDRPIEEIEVGDMVNTPVGPRKVTCSEMTNPDAEVMNLYFSDGGSVECTPDHPFLTDQGLTRADALSIFSGVWTKKHHKKLSLMGSLTNYRDATMSPLQTTGKSIATSTERFGHTTMDPFPKGITSTTKTGTISTTMLKIWKLCQLPSICHFMPVTVNGSYLVKPLTACSTKLSQRAKNGTGLQKAASGTANTGTTLGKPGNILPENVGMPNVAKTLLRKFTTKNFVPGCANNATMRGELWQKFSKLAQLAAKSLKIAPKAKSNGSAPHLVNGRISGKRKPVFNITVEDAHCFYANGYLVSNCDSLRTFCEAWQRGLISRLASRATPDDKFDLSGYVDDSANHHKHHKHYNQNQSGTQMAGSRRWGNRQ